MEQFAERSVIADRIDGIADQHYFAALLGDQAAYQQIVGGAILELGISAESIEMRARGSYRGSQCELQAFQLPVHQNAREKSDIMPTLCR